MSKTLGAECELVPSSGGVFEIVVDGSKVFSKKELGRFPNEGEVVERIRNGA